MLLFLEYPKCSTCIKAKKYLMSKEINFTDRNIVEDKPSKDELTEWIKRSGTDIKKFFNTSGRLYKEMGLKDKLKSLSDEEKIELLSSNGMLVKRPLLITDERVVIGFKEDQYIEVIEK